MKNINPEIWPWYFHCPEDEKRFTLALGRREYETIAFKIVAISKQAERWIPLRVEHFSLNEQWVLDEMIQSGYLQYSKKGDNFMLTQRALRLILEEYSGLH